MPSAGFDHAVCSCGRSISVGTSEGVFVVAERSACSTALDKCRPRAKSSSAIHDLSLREWIRMNCHALYFQRLPLSFLFLALFGLNHSSLLVRFRFRIFQPGQRISAFILRAQIQYLAEDGAFPIEMGRGREGDEELASVDSITGSVLHARSGPVLDGTGSHGQDASRVVAECWDVDFLIQRGGMVYGGTALGDVIEWEHGPPCRG